ncbi:MAG: hypothetical protein M9885_01665 [Burkholderiaceae bacterium]|nr:hypothetical protein [Burkholderiaceae bacterium]
MKPAARNFGRGAPSWAGLVALALALPGLAIDPRMFFAAWLAAWWTCLSVALGALANVWMQRLSGGQWGEAMRPVAFALARRMPWVLLLGAPVAIGVPWLYPWAAPDSGWLDDVARPVFVSSWLQPSFFVARLALYALAWWWLARQRDPALPKGRAAAALLAWAMVTSLASIDLLMSLVAGWYSTGFGLIVLTSQMYGGAAFAIAVVATARALPRPLPGRPPLGRDLGNLLLMYAMTWGYLAFMQFLIIWAENLPREISWYLPRLHTGWRWFGLVVVLSYLVAPFLALLFRALKDRTHRLAIVAWALFAAQGLYSTWLVVPSVDARSVHAWWLVPLCALGLPLVLYGSVPRAIDEREVPGPGTPREVTDGAR